LDDAEVLANQEIRGIGGVGDRPKGRDMEISPALGFVPLANAGVFEKMGVAHPSPSDRRAPAPSEEAPEVEGRGPCFVGLAVRGLA